MTNLEIKKAWETMKKEIKKELGLEGGFTMSQKQINNRTATFLICNATAYEDEIRREKETTERVQSYTSWTAEEKARQKEQADKNTAHYLERLERYGTKENEATATLKQLLNSEAFKRFSGNFEKVAAMIEQKEACYYIRFYY